MSESIEVIDNFLPDELFHAFAYACMTNPMYQPFDATATNEESDGSIMSFGENLVENQELAETLFSAQIFFRNADQIHVSNFWLYYDEYFQKLEELLNIKRWIQLRVNCTTGQPKQHIGAYHRDFPFRDFKNYKTCILYLNTNNGGTKFQKDGELIKSKKNRLVKFPTLTMHAGVWATDAKLRYVLNMTYEEN